MPGSLEIAESQLYLLGDIHGEIDVLPLFFSENNLTHISIIQMGDFGIGLAKAATADECLDKLNKVLVHHSSYLYIIRGNHDDPVYFDPNSETSKSRSNITFLFDYTVLKFRNRRILCVGGAISIDRSNREADITYFSEEAYQLDEVRIESQEHIDFVITHTAPDLAFPFDLGKVNHEYFRRDKTLRVDLAQERLDMTKMYYLLKKNPTNKISHWYYGHFHNSKCTLYEGTQFILIDIDEFKLLEF